MPKDKNFKALVRTRIALTGERYTQARAALDTRRPDAGMQTALPGWLEALGGPDSYHRTYQVLRTLPPDTVRTVAITGTRHPNWRARRGSCRLLDDLVLTTHSIAALQACLEDLDPRVRRAAVHTLSCQHCKPDGCVVDVRPVFEKALTDANRSVRQMAVGPLMYGTDEPWKRDLLREVETNDPSGVLREWARRRLEELRARDQSDIERRKLPPDLVAKTERHVGKWIAITDGRMIDAGTNPGAMERSARKRGHHDVCLYWVAPGADIAGSVRAGAS